MAGPPAYELLTTIYTLSFLYDSSEAICGKPFFQPFTSKDRTAGNRISYGLEARPHSYPWQAYISSRFGKYVQSCGGSLIHWKDENASDIIVTAAHCLIDAAQLQEEHSVWEKFKLSISRVFYRDKYYGIRIVNASNITVYLGAHNVEMLGKNVERVPVAAMATGLFHKYSRKEDIAILKLGRKVGYNYFIQGICLPSENEVLPDGTPCVVTGWGNIEFDHSSPRLQQIQVFVFEGEIKARRFKKDTMLCAGSKLSEAGPRKGDSGSPLVCQKNNTYYIQGLVSFHLQNVCSQYFEITAYVRVPKFLNWMKRQIKKLQGKLLSR